jgi:putative inorganic carbon (hco3(-)) transporter
VLFLPLCFIRPDWAIYLAALTAPLYMHPRNLRPGGQLQFTLAEVIIVELAVAGALTFGWQVWRTRSYRALDRTKLLAWAKAQLPLAAPIAALLMLATLSLLVPESYYLKYALREYRTVIFEPIALFVLAVYFLRQRGSGAVVRVLDFFAIGAVAVSLFGIYQYIFPHRANSGSALEATQGGCAVATEGVVRVCSVFTHPDNLGLYIGRLLPFLVAFVLFYDNQGLFGSRRRILYALALLPVGATLIISFSRGAWIGTAAAVLAMLILAGVRRWLLVYGGFALLGLAALPFIRVERITSLFNFGAGSSGTRLYLWQSAWQMISDKPLTGYGLDQFLYYYNPQYVHPNAWTERFTSHPHNSVLDFWLRLGILGIPLLLWLLGSFFAIALRLRLRLKAPDKSAKLRGVLATGLFGSMVHFAVHGLVDNSYFVPDLAIIFCLSFAMLDILRREAVATKENKA